MVIYSAHQDCMMTLLHQLKITTSQYPVHLATITLEVYGPKDPSVVPNPDNHYIRVLYFGE